MDLVEIGKGQGITISGCFYSFFTVNYSVVLLYFSSASLKMERAMDQENTFPEWGDNDKLPTAFVKCLEAVVEVKHRFKKSHRTIAKEWGINPSNLSRWLAGIGPLTEEDIHKLDKGLGQWVYTSLWMVPPKKDGHSPV